MSCQNSSLRFLCHLDQFQLLSLGRPAVHGGLAAALSREGVLMSEASAVCT